MANTVKRRRKIHRQVLTDGTKTVKIAVPIVVDYFLIDGKWEEAVRADEWHKVELAIEAAWPGWFHVFKDGKHIKEGCQACLRKEKGRSR